MFQNAKVLIAGGSGFVGTNLILKMLDLGADVYATVHRKPLQITDDRIHIVPADLLKPEDCINTARGMDYIFMCAANTSGAAVMENTPLAHVVPNVIMNTNMLDAAYQAKVKKFLFISSNTVYPPYEHPVKEEEAFTGELFEKYFCVGWMKRFAEIECEMYAAKIKNPMKIVVVRPGNLYGEYDDFEWETSHVLPALIRKVVERHAPVEVWGDGKDQKDFLYIKDFIDGVVLAMEKMDSFAPINLANGASISVREALDVIARTDHYDDMQVKYSTDKPSMIPVRRISAEKAEQVLGFKARTPFEEGIANTVKWYRKQTGKK